LIEALKIVAFSMFAAILYGIAHDMVTAHLSVEYFTIAHPPLVPSELPVLLALGWGVVATWWVGLILGLLLAISSRFGSWPKQSLQDVRGWIIWLMIISGASALLAGVAGILIALFGVAPIGSWADRIAEPRQIRFAGALFAHSASYLVGALGGIAVCIKAVMLRRRAAIQASNSMSQ